MAGSDASAKSQLMKSIGAAVRKKLHAADKKQSWPEANIILSFFFLTHHEFLPGYLAW